MNSWKAFAAASCLGLMTFVPSAVADQWNKRTILTVNESIQVPGAVLEPGKYVMKLMDSPSNRHIVQIFNEREDDLKATILAIPNYRLQPTGETEFGWWETPAGQPKAMRAWFYPGDNFGQEFAYPKNEAVAIAQRTDQNVPTTYAENQAELATARVGTVDRAGTERELDRDTYTQQQEQPQVAQTQPEAAPAPTPAPEPQVREETQVAQTQPQQEPAWQQQQPQERMRTLPRTASPLPLFGIAGMLALGAGMVLRAAGSRN
jgi:hypothetical protein